MQEELVDINGVSLWTIHQGSGVPVILLNGGPGMCDYLGPVADMIEDLALVCRFEARGCGRSELKPTYDIQTCLSDINALRLHFGFERWIVGGHSWGANLALVYALQYPQSVNGLIYLAGTGITLNWSSEYILARIMWGEKQPDFTYPINQEVNTVGNEDWQRYLEEHDLQSEIQKLCLPALVVHGTRDLRPWRISKHIADLLPQAQFVLLEEAEHYLWLTHNTRLRNLLRSFILNNEFK